jgi:hypothetical protein
MSMESTIREIPLAFGLRSATQTPQDVGIQASDPPLEITVVSTDPAGTRAALGAAAAFVRNLEARIRLIVPQVVSYAAPLEMPPVPPRIVEERLLALASRTAVDTTVDIYLCRDEAETLLRVLKPQSLVIIGGRRRWWSTPERRLARKLRRGGHEVIFTETE